MESITVAQAGQRLEDILDAMEKAGDPKKFIPKAKAAAATLIAAAAMPAVNATSAAAAAVDACKSNTFSAAVGEAALAPKPSIAVPRRSVSGSVSTWLRSLGGGR